MISLHIPADHVGGDEFESIVADGYRELRSVLRSDSMPHPLRIWNFVPGILSPAGDQVDRYMRFNAGRYRVFLDWFGGEAAFDTKVPAASAVGHAGEHFVLHALCASHPAKPIANPRQRAAHRYSQKYGPIPPCFARAVLAGGTDQQRLFIGGTASVLDETSVHIGQLEKQLAETRANLDALITSAFGTDANASDCINHLRAYHVNAEDRSTIEAFLRGAYPNLESLEFLIGDLCRADLLVEIEGCARRS